MSDNKTNYQEYALIGINKALFAFLISSVICILISLVINTLFYEQIVMLTIGALGESGKAGGGTILKTAGLILSMSNFLSVGKFQLGIILLGFIPMVSFLISSLLFRTQKKKRKQMMFTNTIVDGLAAFVYSVFLMITAYLTAGELFGMQIDFASPRNFVFSFVFLLFLQFVLGLNVHKRYFAFTFGMVQARKLLGVMFGFSIMTGVLFILYYLSPYLKSATRMAAFVLLTLPNFAVYLIFLLMGISVDLGDGLSKMTSYLQYDLSFLSLPVEVRAALIVAFMVLVFIALVRIPVKAYWQNLITFALGLSVSSLILAMISRIDLGFVKGALSIRFSISPWKAFLVPLIIILLEGILLVVLKSLCMEIKGESCNHLFRIGRERKEAEGDEDKASTEDDEDDADNADDADDEESDAEKVIEKAVEKAEEPEPAQPKKAEKSEKPVEKPEPEHSQEKQAQAKPENHHMAFEQKKKQEEMDIWKELAERPIPTDQEEKKTFDSQKEIDISLFPRKRPSFKRIMDFSDMEDEIYLEEYEAEETLEEFSDLGRANDGPQVQEVDLEEEEEIEQTIVVSRKPQPEEEMDKTIPYRIPHSKDSRDSE